MQFLEFLSKLFNYNLEPNYQSFHFKKIQIITVNNYADILFREDNYKSSLKMCEQATECFQTCKALCLVKNKYEYLNKVYEKSLLNYPNLELR